MKLLDFINYLQNFAGNTVESNPDVYIITKNDDLGRISFSPIMDIYEETNPKTGGYALLIETEWVGRIDE